MAKIKNCRKDGSFGPPLKDDSLHPGSRYTMALSDRICAELSNGKPLRQICREVGIDWSTVYAWRDRFPDFGRRLQLARDMGEEALLAECLEIADDTSHDTETRTKGEYTYECANTEWIQRSKIRIDTRLKLLAKWNPSKWGEKVEQTHKGDPLAPVALTLNGSDVHG